MNCEIELIPISESESSDESDSLAMEDDSDEDPSFDLQEAQKSLSKLSIKKKKQKDEEEIEIPQLDENEGKSFEIIEKLIHDGKLDKLKKDDCKIYLKRYGLRLTDNKEILLERIKEHLEVKDGRGERKYPISSFVINCKGDACTRDVVMFTQNVSKKIEKKESTNAKCPQTRTVAGRIIRESYGAEKQQHTFTIEVLWTKGKKPLPSLYPLRIKGRNLYKLRTLRQRWENEQDRDKVLKEKHNRGFVARNSREQRIQERENRIMQRQNRMMVKPQQGAPLINLGPKLQETTNFTANQKPTQPFNNNTSNYTQTLNPNNQWAPQIRLAPPPLNPNNRSSAHTGVDQVNHPNRPTFPDRWDPQREKMNVVHRGPGPRYNGGPAQREETCVVYRGPGPRYTGGGPAQRGEFSDRYNGGPVVQRGDFSDRWDPQRGETSVVHSGPGPRWTKNGAVRREVCRFFVRGQCRYGQECKYSHDG